MKAIRVLGVEAKVWLAVDGAYATRPFLKPTLALGSVVVSRLRKDAKRAGHREGWSTIIYLCRGVEGTRQ